MQNIQIIPKGGYLKGNPRPTQAEGIQSINDLFS